MIRYAEHFHMSQILELQERNLGKAALSKKDLTFFQRSDQFTHKVWEVNGVVLGHILYGTVNAGRYLDLITLCVDSIHQREKIGTKLLELMIARVAAPTRWRYVETVIPEKYVTAQLFFKHHNFRYEETEKGYYAKHESLLGQDAYIFRYYPPVASMGQPDTIVRGHAIEHKTKLNLISCDDEGDDE